MQQTPKGNQLHIGLFGKRNVGKSTLMNALLGQNISIVSPVAGTTTDSVHKSKEWHPIGPVVLVDTPGLDDEGALGLLRIQKAKQILEEVDLVLYVIGKPLERDEKILLEALDKKKKPYLVVYNQKESALTVEDILTVNAHTKEHFDQLQAAITAKLNTKEERKCIGDQVEKGEVVLLVMPQDLQAPKGRLILPQVQVLRELLDAKAIPIMTTKETLGVSLSSLKQPPQLIITDSQIFNEVYESCPKNTPLTSFSILMARQKGDLHAYTQGAKVIGKLQAGDKVLVTESCTHNPLHGDIAREKIPNAIKHKVNSEIIFEHVSGIVFPSDLTPYKLIIQCGGCMHTPGQIQARIEKAKTQGVPITNFGIALAYLSNLLDKVWLPS